MQRVLDPAQIEAFAQGQRSIPRVRLPDPTTLFTKRAARLRELSAGHVLTDYLRLMAAVAESQQRALTQVLGEERADDTPAFEQRLESAQEHGMPLLQASGWPRERRWRTILELICKDVESLSGYPAAVGATCAAIRACEAAELERQADLILTADTPTSEGGSIATQSAPFIMAALQVHWVGMVSSLSAEVIARAVGGIDIPGICPVCGSLPVASIVRSDKAYQGYRYLHCALCATEWHLVRVKCSQCLETAGIHYHTLEGPPEGPDEAVDHAPAATRAEACDSCRTYRKIFYQEYEPNAEPLADDLGSLALDLLMSEAGFLRGSGHPLLWQDEAP